MEIPSTLYIALGAMIAALITGFFSYVNLVSSKENKVSEFRQDWINGLRKEIADFTTGIQGVIRINESFSNAYPNDKEMKEAVADYHSHSSRYFDLTSDSISKIQLRLNPKQAEEHPESHEAKLLSCIRKARDQFNARDYDGARISSSEIRALAVPLLKGEWERVKNGEPEYQKVRKMAFKTIQFGIVIVIVFALIALVIPYAKS